VGTGKEEGVRDKNPLELYYFYPNKIKKEITYVKRRREKATEGQQEKNSSSTSLCSLYLSSIA